MGNIMEGRPSNTEGARKTGGAGGRRVALSRDCANLMQAIVADRRLRQSSAPPRKSTHLQAGIGWPTDDRRALKKIELVEKVERARRRPRRMTSYAMA